MTPRRPTIILLVEDSPTDVEITRRALRHSESAVSLHVCRDGEEALDFLYRRGPFAESPRPHLILLDLNLPKVGGLEVLSAIKFDEKLKIIPVVVLSTSESDDDIEQSYRLGVNSYFSKPTEFAAYKRLLLKVERYWAELAKLPHCTSA